MLIPEPLQTLLDEGIVSRVLRQLKSGKEASLYVVEADGVVCAAKVYKEASQRAFRQRADYTEGRKVRDSRAQRAMDQGSSFGRKQREEAWQHSEADALDRLTGLSGVRVPKVLQRCERVLLMDLVCDADGEPAPQLAMLRFSREEAYKAHEALIYQIARMLCAGIVHADLSEYNVLLSSIGLVVIDFPQAVDAASNTNAKRLLVRDVASVTRFFAGFAPELRRSEYGQEMWLLYEQSALRPDSVLTGRFQAARGRVDEQIVLREIAEAKADAAKRAAIAEARGKKPR